MHTVFPAEEEETDVVNDSWDTPDNLARAPPWPT